MDDGPKLRAADETVTLHDTDALRALVEEIVEDIMVSQSRGPLGDRVLRHIRKTVRQEVQRVLTFNKWR